MSTDNENLLFNLDKEKQEIEINETEEVVEKKMSEKEVAEKYHKKNMNLFDTNTLEQDKDVTERSKLLSQVPSILKLSENEKKLYMQNYEKGENKVNVSALKEVQNTAFSHQNMSSGYLSVGKTIREARIAANISYEDVYEKTKIRIQILKSLEEENLGALPATTYLKAYLKKLCAIYDLPFEEIYKKYLSLVNKNKQKVDARARNREFVPGRKPFLFRYIQWAAFLSTIILLIVLFYANFLSGNDEKLNPVDLSIFVEKQKLPVYTFPIPK